MAIRLKRAYDPPSEHDGYRVLVDRIWPRGIGRAELRIDAWRKDLAPSAELRRRFGHDPSRWAAFEERYARDLEQRSQALADLADRARTGTVTLVFGARDREHNNAAALKRLLERQLAKKEV